MWQSWGEHYTESNHNWHLVLGPLITSYLTGSSDKHHSSQHTMLFLSLLILLQLPFAHFYPSKFQLSLKAQIKYHALHEATSSLPSQKQTFFSSESQYNLNSTTASFMLCFAYFNFAGLTSTLLQTELLKSYFLKSQRFKLTADMQKEHLWPFSP